ncbi:MAG: serine hydrolase domain-containing protein [Phycisphaeraceae bacterium]|nr:serine hydrolase domain-containing protein [Phycisphaeraceae bacterium]
MKTFRPAFGVSLCLVLIAGPCRGQIDLDPLRKLLRQRVERQQVAGGAIRLVHRGRVILDEGFGYDNLNKKTPFPKDKPVIIASISKPMLGTAIFRLVDQGRLDPDKPIDFYLPEFKNLKLESGRRAKRAPTVRELLSHTAGMRIIKTKGGTPWYRRWTHGKKLAEVVGRYPTFPLHAHPGTTYAYSGIGTDVAARVAEVASELPRNELLIEQLCKPLGLKNTFYRETDRMKNHPLIRYARAADGTLKLRPGRPTVAKNGYSSSGGAVISTTRDVSVWLAMFRNRGRHEGQRYLSEKQIAPLLTRGQLGPAASGGLMVRRSGKRPGYPVEVGHTGSVGTFCWLDFERDLIAVVLTQTKGAGGGFRKDVRAMVHRLIPKSVRTPGSD